jgi:hypothetical protein
MRGCVGQRRVMEAAMRVPGFRGQVEGIAELGALFSNILHSGVCKIFHSRVQDRHVR